MTAAITAQSRDETTAPRTVDVQARIVRFAGLSCLAYSAFTSVVLAAWFRANAAEPWSWKSILALVCAALGLAHAVLVWRAPSRVHALSAVLVMVASVARVGMPADWTFHTYALFAITLAFAAPLLRAAVALK